jgi:pilus assembly protein Flp/PilA
MTKAIRVFLSDQSGATSIEYAIIASCIAAVIVATVNGLGGKVLAQYTSVNAVLADVLR